MEELSFAITSRFQGGPLISENGDKGAGGDLSPAHLVGSDEPNHLLVELYCDLRALAERLMREQRSDSLLQSTALVHEACLKLFGRESLEGATRTDVLAMASVAMRNLLVDRARTRNRQKRRPNGERVSFERISLAYENRAVDLLALHEALSKLGQFDPEMAQAVELRFFGGLSMEETARCLEVPLRTLERRWEATRFWLRAEIE